MDLVARARNMLTAPKAEWPMIARESTGTAELYTAYVVPLATITPVAAILGNLLFGGPLSFKESVVVGITMFAMSLVGVYVIARIASKIAPAFGGRDDFAQGIKLVAYASTAAWVAGVFTVIPALAMLSMIGGIYSLYLLYTGASVMMGVPQERSVGYTAVVILVAIAVYVVVGFVVGSVAAIVSAVR
jgi:Yip1 domain